MRKNIFKPTYYLFIFTLLIGYLTVSERASAQGCLIYTHYKNLSSTKTITRIGIVTAGFSQAFNVNIPPGGTADIAGHFPISGSTTVNITYSANAAGLTCDVRAADYDGSPVTCSNATGRTVSVNFSATNCLGYFFNVSDVLYPCQ